jgi:2-oxoglutarate ferredoxin oxidoreductase subunit beta
MTAKTVDVYQYLRHEKKFPLIWCPGCGNGIVLGSMIRAIDALGIVKDKTAIVSGIGCSGRVSTYMDFNTLHTTHGRALAFATGLKFARPELTVLVAMGDGDALAIGGNHFIHAARRNIDLTAIVFNNSIYGMTGGQISPTTPVGGIASTARLGNIENPFDIPTLAEAAGASFVARGSTYHVDELDELMVAAIRKKGFSVLDVITPCPTIFGRYNRQGSGVSMLKHQRDSLVSMHDAEHLNAEELKGKMRLGICADHVKTEFCEEYESLIERAQKI